MNIHQFQTNSWWLWQIKSLLIPVWYFYCDYMTVTFEVISVWSKNFIYKTAAYKASQNGSLSKHLFCIFVCEPFQTNATLFLLFTMASHSPFFFFGSSICHLTFNHTPQRLFPHKNIDKFTNILGVWYIMDFIYFSIFKITIHVQESKHWNLTNRSSSKSGI